MTDGVSLAVLLGLLVSMLLCGASVVLQLPFLGVLGGLSIMILSFGLNIGFLTAFGTVAGIGFFVYSAIAIWGS